MINKKIFLGASLFLLLTVIIAIYKTREQKYRINIFNSEQGWGYDISIRKKLCIHQPFMPAIKGQVAFPDSKSARKTAALVVKKLRNKQSPVISQGELRSIVSF